MPYNNIVNASELRKLLDGNALSQIAAARELGIDPRTMRRYVAGDTPIPRVLELAMLFLISNRRRKNKT